MSIYYCYIFTVLYSFKKRGDKMKVYLAYLKDYMHTDINQSFYGYTDKKEIFDLFKRMRCKEAFTYRTIKLTKEEFNKFSSKFVDKLIEIFPLYTKSVNDDGEITTKDYSLPLTQTENDLVSLYKYSAMANILDPILTDELVDFNKRIKKENKPLYYILNNVFNLSYIINTFTFPIDESINVDEVPVDELNLFIKLYRFTLEKESEEERVKRFESLEDIY